MLDIPPIPDHVHETLAAMSPDDIQEWLIRAEALSNSAYVSPEVRVVAIEMAAACATELHHRFTIGAPIFLV